METASIALYLFNGQHYLQIITAENQNHYFLKISANTANTMAHEDNVPIEDDIVITVDMVFR